MRFVAKRIIGIDAGRIESMPHIDGFSLVLFAQDWAHAAQICKKQRLVYCHVLVDEPTGQWELRLVSEQGRAA